MVTNFDILYFKLITEETEQKNIQTLGPIIPNKPLYENIKLAFIPGNVKLLQHNYINTIFQYCEIADKILIFISNISTKEIANRVLSKSHLQPIAKLIFDIKELNLHNDDIDNICNQIINNSNNITYNLLISLLNKLIEQFNLFRNIYDEYILKIKKIEQILNESLFKSVKIVNNKEITPEKIKQSVESYINTYNLQNKVNTYISKNPSPMLDIVSLVNNNCKNCVIYLGSLKNNENNTQWDSLLKKFELNPTNEIIPYYTNVMNVKDIYK